MCFPLIFRGALDVGATTINAAMKIACVEALAALAPQESHAVVADASGSAGGVGADHLIPRPADPCPIVEPAPAVAHAAMDSAVAIRPIEVFGACRGRLEQFIFRSGLLMKPVHVRTPSLTGRGMLDKMAVVGAGGTA